MNYYHNPVKTYIGEDTIGNLPEIINLLKLKTDSIVFLHRGNDFADSDEYKIIIDGSKNYKITELVYTQSNPSLQDVVDLLIKLKEIDYSLVIGVGGGSIMDISKALRTFKKSDIVDRIELKNVLKDRKYSSYPLNECKLIEIPTTTGTGSEVTPFASLWDKKEGVKYSLFGESIYADVAIIDRSLVKSLPGKIAISTGLDALCHAVEAYWAKNSNDISRMYSVKAIKLILNNIIRVSGDSTDSEAKGNLLSGSFFAGMAFSNTKTTSCHSISYPLTMMFGIPHGTAAFLSLSEMFKINKTTLTDADEFYRAFGTDDVPKKISSLFKVTGISPKLSDYGVKLSDIDELTDRSFTKGRMDNNPVVIEKSVLKEVFKRML